jgi:uncharacterized membrane protein YfcA
MDWLIYPLVGCLSGLLAGLFGIGGGLVIVPVVAAWFTATGATVPADQRMHFAIGTSLGVIIFTSVSSLLAHHRRGAVLWPAVRRLVPGILAGGLIGAAVADALSNDRLESVFGLFVLGIATHMIRGRLPDAQRPLPGFPGFAAAGIVIGAFSALAGIGGGVMTVPFLLWCAVPMRSAVGTAAACTLPVAVAGAIGFVIAGWDAGGAVPGATGYVYWPAVAGIAVASVFTAPLGARLAHALPVAQLRRAFAVLLGILGLRMLLF